jgi:purine-nucleoside phosphorylase
MTRIAADYFDRVEAAAGFLRARLDTTPEIAIVLGSGLGAFADRLAEANRLGYAEIPHWPTANVVGHAGVLVAGNAGDRRVLTLAGRAHFYEGHDLPTVTFATRVLGRLGVRTLVLTNAAGGINTSFPPGTLMVIDDHINLMGSNPLVGPNDDRFGVRFPDMTNAYAPRLRAIADDASRATGIAVRHGIYAGLHGPSYETPAEIRFLRAIGADAVGMSTVPETIVARHMGIEVLGLSCITNPAAGVLPEPLNHDEVMEVARRVSGEFIRLLEGIVARC